MPLFLVDTVVTYRIKYAVEAKELGHAFDEVSFISELGDMHEVTQRCLGEQIIDGREITRDDFHSLLETLKADKNELSSHWLGDKLIWKINYEDSTG